MKSHDNRDTRHSTLRSVLLAGAAPLLAAVVLAPAQGFAADATSPAATATTTTSTASSDAATATQPAPGEVTITARKRTEVLRDVPVSAVVLDANILAQRGEVLTTADIINSVPGARFNNLGTSTLSEISFRSAGTAQNTSADTPVGLYANGVYIQGGPQFGRNFSRIDLFDLGSAQVFLGTQGGLLGRNSVGGSVNLIDAAPQFSTYSGYALLDYSPQVEGEDFQVVSNLGLNDHWAIRLGMDVPDQVKGNFHNVDNNTYFDANHGWMGRAQLRYANGPFDATLLVQDQEYHVPTTNFAIYVPAGTAGYPVGYTGDPFTYHQNAGELGVQNIHQVELTASYDFGFAQLVDTTSFRRRFTHFFGDADGMDPSEQAVAVADGNPGAATLNVFQFQNLVDTTDFYNEDLHLVGKKIGPVSWLAGIEFLHTQSGYETNYALTGGSATKIVPSVNDYTLRYTSEAYYGQVNWDILPQLTASVDGRYTVDKKNFTLQSYTGAAVVYPAALAPANITVIPYTDRTYSGTNFSYDATLTYKFMPRWMVYAKVGTAYRPGGFNTVVNPPPPNLPPVPIQPTYNPETTTSYEIGTKGNILTNLFVTLDTYSNTTNNTLTQVNDGCGPTIPACTVKGANFVTNAGLAKTWGVEGTATMTYNFLGGHGNASFAGSRQGGKYFNSVYAGLNVPQSPSWIASAELYYEHPLMERVVGFMDWTYRGQWGGFTNLNAPIIPLANLSLIDVRGGVRWRGIELAGYASNLTDEHYYVYKAATYYSEGEPLQAGLQIKYKW